MHITYKREIKNSDVTEEELVRLLLKDRKIEDIDDFKNPPLPFSLHLSDFGYKEELKKTFSLLEKIKKENGTIVVYTDYDADGITGGAILWETLFLLGFHVMPYVPHRKKEGYGFSVKGIDNVHSTYNPALIISVDHGITAHEKVTYAKKLGIPIIITDHHLKPEKIPTDSIAIFHLPILSGSGVSYFFSKEIFEYFARKEVLKNEKQLKHNFETEYLSLASIGTIADLVPLVGPSRSIVKYGLEAFPLCKRKGLKHILKESKIDGKVITPYEIGFIIAPRINAVGRLEHAIEALRLLCTTSDEKAHHLASNVGKLNQDRQELVKKAVENAVATVEKQKLKRTLPKLIILTSTHWHEGIIGLIASKIAETYYRPTIVMTEVDGFLKGSARSTPLFHITNFLRTLKEYLIDVGGHAQAAGFTIEKAKVNTFIKKAHREAQKTLKEKDLERRLETDFKIPLSLINSKLAKLIEKLSPFGIGNPQPIFFSHTRLTNARIIGKKNDHLKIEVKDETMRNPLELMAFSKAEDFKKLSLNQSIDIVYQIELNRWNGNEKLQGKLLYWR